MIVDAQYRNHVSHLVGRRPTRVLPGELDDCLDDDLACDPADVRRMIELSGIIGLDCRLLGGD